MKRPVYLSYQYRFSLNLTLNVSFFPCTVIEKTEKLLVATEDVGLKADVVKT